MGSLSLADKITNQNIWKEQIIALLTKAPCSAFFFSMKFAPCPIQTNIYTNFK